jgi:hypothetical protein
MGDLAQYPLGNILTVSTALLKKKLVQGSHLDKFHFTYLATKSLMSQALHFPQVFSSIFFMYFFSLVFILRTPPITLFEFIIQIIF